LDQIAKRLSCRGSTFSAHEAPNELGNFIRRGIEREMAPAIFRSPIGTALFAVEVLYGGMDFEADALIYCMLAAIVAYAINGWFVGWQSLFRVPAHLYAAGLSDYGWYIVLGAASGIVATILPEVFYRVRDGFVALPVPTWTKPAIGGLLLGLLALRLPQVLGGGYGWIQEAIDGRLAVRLLLVLIVAKILALSLTVSSGGSGGVFAPSLFIGAMLGGAFAGIFHQPPAAWVIVGMAAVFGGAARVPIADGSGNDRWLPTPCSCGTGRHAQFPDSGETFVVFQVRQLIRSPGSRTGGFAGPSRRKCPNRNAAVGSGQGFVTAAG
jgi:Voltage gated chloride channel